MIASRVLSDGRYLTVEPLTFGRARLTLSENTTTVFYSEGW